MHTYVHTYGKKNIMLTLNILFLSAKYSSFLACAAYSCAGATQSFNRNRIVRSLGLRLRLKILMTNHTRSDYYILPQVLGSAVTPPTQFTFVNKKNTSDHKRGTNFDTQLTCNT